MISLKIFNQLIFVTMKCCVLFEVRTEFLYYYLDGVRAGSKGLIVLHANSLSLFHVYARLYHCLPLSLFVLWQQINLVGPGIETRTTVC
jgi:hypothetical protein